MKVVELPLKTIKIKSETGRAYAFTVEIDGVLFPCMRVEVSPFDATECAYVMVKLEMAVKSIEIETKAMVEDLARKFVEARK